jgi:hypothetical protein
LFPFRRFGLTNNQQYVSKLGVGSRAARILHIASQAGHVDDRRLGSDLGAKKKLRQCQLC